MCAELQCVNGIDDVVLLPFEHQKKSTAGVWDPKAWCLCAIKALFLFAASSGELCGKKTNPCGEDAVCNQTNVNTVCQCKPGFKRNQKTGQCEGNAFSLCSLKFDK